MNKSISFSVVHKVENVKWYNIIQRTYVLTVLILKSLAAEGLINFVTDALSCTDLRGNDVKE